MEQVFAVPGRPRHQMAGTEEPCPGMSLDGAVHRCVGIHLDQTGPRNVLQTSEYGWSSSHSSRRSSPASGWSVSRNSSPRGFSGINDDPISQHCRQALCTVERCQKEPRDTSDGRYTGTSPSPSMKHWCCRHSGAPRLHDARPGPTL